MVAPMAGLVQQVCVGSARRAVSADDKVGIGEIAAVTPFRYARLLFALILGMTLLGERPDLWTFAGAAVIIASGLYTLIREQRLARRSYRQAKPKGPL